ncbi:MAG: hypothetical protein GY701_18195 [Sulfitobacter sp.]|nr:hypothetical protein [Sulfitobacter sp.]
MPDDIDQARKSNEEIIRQGKDLLDQAQTVRDGYAQVYEKLGISREGVQRYLGSEHFGADGRKHLQQQVTALEAEFDRDIQQVEEQHRARNSPKPSKKHGTHKMI